MDNASDLAIHVGRALASAGFGVREDPARLRDSWTFIVQARDWPSSYRVQISEVEPTDDELHWPEVQVDEQMVWAAGPNGTGRWVPRRAVQL